MNKAKFLLAGFAVACMPVFTATASDGITYVPQAPYVSGEAIIAPAKAGAYVYSSHPQNDSRGTMRFMLGQAPRQNYDLFSAQEEAALWRTREMQREAVAQAEARARARHTHRKSAPKLDWPKVVLVGDKTCVPRTSFANAPDWQQHIVCWSSGDRRVE
jgi:hypothetical protein